MSNKSQAAGPLLNLTPRVRALRTLRHWIENGTLPMGERVPPEQILADKLGVSRTTIRAALERLEQEKLLEPVKAGRGRTVADASSLRGPLARSILVLDPTLSEKNHGVDLSQKQILDCAISTVQAMGLHTLLLHPNLCHGQHIRELITQKPQGLLVLGQMDGSNEIIEAFLQERVPVACFADSSGEPVSTVKIDHQAGAASLTRWLLNRGHSRILPCWVFQGEGQQPSWLPDRLAGYREEVAEHGMETLAPVECHLRTNPTDNRESFQAGARVVAGHLVEHFTGEKPVDAIMALSDESAFTIAAACRIFGREPNSDVEIVGFGNSRTQCVEQRWERSGPVATVDPQPRSIASELVSLLLEPSESSTCKEIAPRLVQFEHP